MVSILRLDACYYVHASGPGQADLVWHGRPLRGHARLGLNRANTQLHYFVDVQASVVTISDIRLGAIGHDDIALPQGRVGTVEVFVDQYNSWLPVCSTTSWDNGAESKVLCRQLGFNATLNPGIRNELE